MKSSSLNIGQSHIITVEHGFTFLEKYVLKFFHPRALIIDLIGSIWFFYYLWLQNWKMAFVSIVIARLIAYSAVINVNPQEMSETTLGKLALLHVYPANFFLQFLGLIILSYGTWMHSPEYIISGASTILLGHLFRWKIVSSRLEDR